MSEVNPNIFEALTPAQCCSIFSDLRACRPPAPAEAPTALNVDQLLSGIEADPRYARAASVLTAMVAFFSGADAEAPVAILRERARQAEEFRDWIEDAKPRVTA